MLFGSGVLLAVLMSSLASPKHPSANPGVNLTLRMPRDQFDLKSLIPKRPLIEVKSMKVVGASGLAFYFPGRDNLAAGIGVTAFKIAPQKRATQIVFGVRVRF